MRKNYNAVKVAEYLRENGIRVPGTGRYPTSHMVRRYVSEHYPRDKSRGYRDVVRFLVREWYRPSDGTCKRGCQNFDS